MKRLVACVMLGLISISSLTGCYGKFALTRLVYNANGQVGNKFLKSLLTWVLIIVPVYALAGLADFIIFNLIEFWSGANPVAAGEKDFQYVKGDETFQIHATKSGDMIDFTIRHYNKAILADTTSVNWDIKTGKSVVSTDKDGAARQFVATNDDGRVRVDQYAEGKVQDVVWFTAPEVSSLRLASLQ